jgi:uncharacterized protein YndB with AHSA1/START domain
MSVTSIDKDLDSLTMTLVADFDAPAERVWELFADPRKLERWWGPPTHPATVKEHELKAGGGVTYFMTGPEGDQHHGWWRISSVDPPKSLEFVDGFADEDGTPNDDMPSMTMRMELTSGESGTRMELRSTFNSREQMEEMVEMGMEEGIREGAGQMDAILAE